MRLSLGRRLERREHEKQAKHYLRMARHNERRLKQYLPGSKDYQDCSAARDTYRRLYAEAMAEVEKLTRRIKTAEREEKR